MDCRRRAGKFAYGCFDHPAKLGLDLPRIFFGDDAPVEAQRDAVRHDIRVDARRAGSILPAGICLASNSLKALECLWSAISMGKAAFASCASCATRSGTNCAS